jgi:hypothetical protein
VAHRGGSIPDDALLTMSAMRLGGVETILWTGGMNGNLPRAAAALGYDPEWVLLGDGTLDNPTALWYSTAADSFHGRAATVTSHVPERAGDTPTCERAFREIDQAYADSDLTYVCDYYRGLFLALMAIQVAGPDLAATQVEKGLLAISQRGGDPSMAGTSFTIDDRSYVDDTTAEWWDATGGQPGRGCYRTIDGGARHSVGDWPDQNWGTAWSPSDECDTWSRSTRINLA